MTIFFSLSLSSSYSLLFFFLFYFWMTSNENYRRETSNSKRKHNDGHTSDDSLLLMADEPQDRTPLLYGYEDRSTRRDENLSQRSLSPSTHCHVPDDTFDYGARNRLLLVLVICIIFVGIEIGGMFFFSCFKLKTRRENIFMRI